MRNEISSALAARLRALSKAPVDDRARAHRERVLGHLREYLATKRPDTAEIEAQIAELETPQKLEPLAVVEPREEERTTPSKEIVPAPDIATPPTPEVGLIERPVFCLVIAGILAAAGTALALDVALSGDDELYGGSEDRVLRY